MYNNLVYLLFSTLLAVNTYQIDKDESRVYWLGEKLTGSHDGLVSIHNGEILTEGTKVLSGNFKIDMNSIKNLDIESETYRGYLEDHLKSNDFFDVTNYPYSEIKIIEIVATENSKKNTVTFLCDLTIKGITHPIEIPVKFSVGNYSAHATGVVKVDRSLYDIKYKSMSFFPDIGDKLIYDDFIISFSIVARRLW